MLETLRAIRDQLSTNTGLKFYQGGVEIATYRTPYMGLTTRLNLVGPALEARIEAAKLGGEGGGTEVTASHPGRDIGCSRTEYSVPRSNAASPHVIASVGSYQVRTTSCLSETTKSVSYLRYGMEGRIGFVSSWSTLTREHACHDHQRIDTQYIQSEFIRNFVLSTTVQRVKRNAVAEKCNRREMQLPRNTIAFRNFVHA